MACELAVAEGREGDVGGLPLEAISISDRGGKRSGYSGDTLVREMSFRVNTSTVPSRSVVLRLVTYFELLGIYRYHYSHRYPRPQ